MPPKKQAKKGINYRPAVLAKDIIPPTVKQPPREPRTSKPVENFPQIVKKYEFEIKDKLEPWPGNEPAKTFDFGIESTNQFKDPQQHLVRQLLTTTSRVIEWKSMQQCQHLQQLHRGEESQQKLFSGQHTKSLHEIKYIDEETEPTEEPPVAAPLVMIQSFMRDETVEQMEKRKKEEADKAALTAKDKKKAPKGKEEIKEEGPVKVKDVEMADMIVNEGMLPECRWIGSQLQLIKQRNICDIYTQQPIWKKIYPQQDGLPVICKSGRYWVKLYYMGKEVKVQIDDELPLNSQLNYLLPRSSKDNERWPLILSKALLKLTALNNAGCDMVGNGLILYSLTGLIGERISLHNFESWQKLGDQLTDKHYLDKDVFVTCYSSQKFKPHPPSNLIRCGADLHKLLELNNSEYHMLSAERSRSSDGKRQNLELEQKIDIKEEVDNRILSDYAYFVGDHLFNGGFNMVYAQKISNKEMRLRQEYNQLTKVSLSNKARDEKLEYRRKKKEKKERIHLEEQKRQNLLKKPPQPYHFLKICADVTIQGDYSTDQIGIAKKCILNELPYPPNYDIPEARPEDNKSTRSYSVTNKVKQEKEEMVIKPLDDFSLVPNAIDPLNRNEKGVWVKDQDFLASFEYLQIFYDPNKLAEKQVSRVEYSVSSQFIIDENKEVLILEKEEGRTEDTVLIFGFSPEFGTKKASIKPYTMLQKFNFQEFSTIQSSPALQDNISCSTMKLSNSNHVFKILTLSKGGYCYWISSNAKFRLTSIAGYLTDFEGYTSKSFPCDYPAVQAQKYNLIFRTKLQTTEVNTVVIRLKNIDPYVLKSLRYKLVTISPNNIYVDNENQGVHQNRFESTLIVSTYLRLQLKPNNRYYLLLEGILPFNLPEGNMQIEVLSKSPAATFELVEQVEPLRYVEKYNVNKYGLICRERLFTNNENVATVYFQLVNGEVGVVGVAPSSTDKKAGKKGGKEEAQPEVIETELKEKRPVKLEFFCGDQLVVSEYGYNEALLSNLALKSTKGDSNSYYIQATFDLRQWPEAKNADENTSKIFWSLKVNSYDSIAIVRDTFKQDQEKDIKKQWEDKEPGRAQRAKKSRKRYMLQLKADAGEQLTEEEMKIITAPRLTKKQLMEEEKKANEDKKGAKGAKKDDKKGKDAKGKEEVVKVVEEKHRQLPKSQNNIMLEIKEFLKHLQAQRVLYEEQQQHTTSSIRSPDDLRSIQQGCFLAAQQRVAIIQRNIEDRELTKIHQKQEKQQLQSFISQTMEGYKKGWQQYVKTRNQIFERSKTRTEKQKQLVELAKSEKPNITEADLGKLINQYEAIEGSNSGIVNVLHMVRKNIRIGVLNDKLTAALAAFDIDEINRIDEQIKKDTVEGMTPELLQQMSDLMEEAKKNPNYILEKQTEAKKGKKGKK